MYTLTTFTVLGLAAIGSCHMKMLNPEPYNNASLSSSPMDANGGNFPCKANGVYKAGSTATWALGSTQTITFLGSAVHGGGSCQFSVTYDENPTASSEFKVIHSIEGGCPRKGVTGNDPENAAAVDPDTFPITIPTNLPTGKATFAWTWFNKVGNREMYMNCAPVEFTAASSKRSVEDAELMARNYTQLMERDQAAFNALPGIFKANIGSASNGCQTPESFDVVFPNPGDSVETLGTTALLPTSSLPAACLSAKAAATAAPAGSKATTTSAPIATSTSVPGGVFFGTTPGSSASQAASTPVASAPSSPASAPAAASTPSVVPSSPIASSPVASSPAPASSGTTGSGFAITAGTACTSEGDWNCIGGTSYQRCASGTWSVVMPLAAGTSCTVGESANINMVASGSKRSIRFPRRNVQIANVHG